MIYIYMYIIYIASSREFFFYLCNIYIYIYMLVQDWEVEQGVAGWMEGEYFTFTTRQFVNFSLSFAERSKSESVLCQYQQISPFFFLSPQQYFVFFYILNRNIKLNQFIYVYCEVSILQSNTTHEYVNFHV